MRNPNRTTKPERRAVRASNPTVCRAMGIAAAVRLQRQRSMRPEAEQLDRFTRALGLETLMSESADPGVNHWSAHGPDVEALAADAARIVRPLSALIAGLTERVGNTLAEDDAERYRDWVLNGEMRSPSGRFRAIRGWAGGVTIIDEPNPDDVPYPTVESVTVEDDGWLTLKYAPHISLGGLDAVDAAADAAAPDFREWWCAPEAEQPPAIGTEHLHKVADEFQRTILPDLIARPDDDNEES